jgi:hypothetical protein
MIPREGDGEAVILVKAAPVIGSKHGETVCCAGLDLDGNWLRLFPVSFRVMEEATRFKRWDVVRFSWRKPTADDRIESRHINSQSLKIIGNMKPRERANFLDRRVVTSLNAERAAGRSLALLKPEIRRFLVERKAEAAVEAEQARIDAFHNQADLFVPRPAVPRVACQFDFKYQYSTDDGAREGTCQDWETTATFFRWRLLYGEQGAIDRMKQTFGEKMPERGLYFAMGTHSRYPDVWLINGLIQLARTEQASLF